ncbi:hypothetical protein HHI36_020718 [Cryptolaemus montrouzieri]|uniref:Uncharacterized protein n=1 Tax=Cryptolaemus montrouzieri TaxID=559131 RepID=A0ABD2NBK5_9CUCU
MIRIVEEKMVLLQLSTNSNMIKDAKKECTKEYYLKINPQMIWIIPEYLNLIKTRNKKYVRWKQLLNDFTRENFMKAKNASHNLRRKLKREYTENKFEQAKGNSKKSWDVLNNICGRGKIDNIAEANGQIISNKNNHTLTE